MTKEAKNLFLTQNSKFFFVAYMSKEIQIFGFGSKVPDRRVSNERVVQDMEGTNPEWIEKNTGIKTRAIITDGDSTVGMGTDAAKMAIGNALTELQSYGKKVSETELISKIRTIICATNSQPEIYPSTGVKIQDALGIKENCHSFDIQSGCTSWLFGLDMGRKFARDLSDDEYILLVGTDAVSTTMDYHSRDSVLFGDAAGAVLLGHSLNDTKSKILDFKLGTVYSDSLYLKSGFEWKYSGFDLYANGKRPKIQKFHTKMNGRTILKLSLEKVIDSMEKVLKQNNLKKTDIQHFIPHQTNINVVRKFCEFLDFPMDKIPLTLPEYGSLSTAGIPTHFMKLLKENRVKRGDLCLVAGYGAGFSFGAGIFYY